MTIPVAAAPSRKPVRRWLFRFMGIAVCVYLSLAVLVFVGQRRLIFPGAATQGTAASIIHPDAASQLVRLSTPDGTSVVALFGGALSPSGEALGDDPTRLTLLYFYGNGMCANNCWDQFNAWRKLGVNVMIPDYVGYGMSGGKPSEAGCRATADAAYEWLESRGALNGTVAGDATGAAAGSRIVAVGWSLGSAVAADLAYRRPVAGLAVFSPFTSMADMGRKMFPWLPVKLVVRDRFDTLSKIPHVVCPIFIAHGTQDHKVPFEMSARLRAAAVAPVDYVPVEGAGHGNVFYADGDQLMVRFGAFLGRIQ
jgi:hypothetical protein